MGATSGINIMNPNPEAATANVYFVNPSGFNAQNFGVSSVTIPGFANGFVYTLTQHNLPNGFTGAAQVVSNIPVAAVSANVDYQVDGDGSAIFNAYNPCGLYRTAGVTALLDENGLPVFDEQGNPVLVSGCTFGDPFDITGRSVTKSFVDEDGEPVAGVTFSIVGNNPAFPFQRDGVSGVDGSATFTNVPVGEYDLYVNSVPDYVVAPDPLESQETFTVNQGGDVFLENELLFNQSFNFTACVSAFYEGFGFLDAPVCSDRTLSDINVRVYEVVGFTEGQFESFPIRGDIVFEGLTGDDGATGAALAPGEYLVCYYDENRTAVVAQTGEIINPDLPVEPMLDEVYGFICGQTNDFGIPFYGTIFTLEAGQTHEFGGPVLIYEGSLDIFVWEQGSSSDGQVPLAGVEICLDQLVWDINIADYTDQVQGCVFTDEDGIATFEAANDFPIFHTSIVADPDTFETAGGALFLVPHEYWPDITGQTVFHTEEFLVNPVLDGYELYCADGGELTATAADGFPLDGDPFLPCNGALYDPNQAFFMHYHPTWDLVQDSWLQDINAANELRGTATFDLQIEMRPVQ